MLKDPNTYRKWTFQDACKRLDDADLVLEAFGDYGELRNKWYSSNKDWRSFIDAKLKQFGAQQRELTRA